jgi:hypothetical protein
MVIKKIKQDDKETNNKDSNSLTQNLNKIKQKIKELDYYKILRHSSIAVVFLFIFFMILLKINMLPVYWNLTYMFYFMVFVITLFLTQKIKKIPESKREKSGMIYIFSYLFLLTLIIFTANQFLNRQIILDYMHHLTALSISFGFLTFYSYRSKVEKEIEQEKVNEEKSEKKRAKEFDNKFPKINRIPILRNIIKWMYKEGWKYSWGLIVIFIFFLSIRIILLIKTGGSYIDEYNHIFSGLNLGENGKFATIFNGEAYTRWSQISFLVGIYLSIFGKYILVAKLVPVSLGIISFIFLLLISKRIVEKKYCLLLLLLYSISPWTIFNHVYIRGYVFYESSILIISYLFMCIYENSKLNKLKIKLIICWILVLLIVFINYYFSHDSSSILIILSFLFYLLFFIFFVTDIRKNKRNRRIIVIVSLILIIFFIKMFNFGVIFDPGETNSSEDLFYYYFLELNIIVTILSLGSLSFIKQDNLKKYSIILLGIILFVGHLISSKDLHLMRGVLYFFPLYYLGSIFTINRINKYYIKIFLILLIIITLFLNYPANFIDNPNIPNEIVYRDYNSAYKYIKNNCQDKTIYGIIDRPYISYFYGVNTDYTSYDEGIENDKRFYLSSNGEYKTYLGNIPTINDLKLLEIINKKDNICIITYDKYGHVWNFLNKETYINMEEKLNKKHFEGIDVYYR